MEDGVTNQAAEQQDLPEDDRPKLQDALSIYDADTTLNVMSSRVADGYMLMMLHEAGLQYLFAGARANVGVKSGRYMFEVRVVEQLPLSEGVSTRVVSAPTHTLRLGFSLAGSSPIIGDNQESFCFDADGSFMHNKQVVVFPKEAAFGTFSVVVDMVEHKVSMFKDGGEFGAVQDIPQVFRGKTLFPTVTFKNLTVHVNFGPAHLQGSPLRCRLLQDAAAEDVEISSEAPSKAGSWEVMFPVFMPDEGGYDWLEWFLEKNPHFTEISDRKLLDWITRSGMRRTSQTKCNDKPDFGFAVPSFEDGTVKKMLAAAASLQNRHTLLMEVRGNLIKTEREALLSRFRLPQYRKTAQVMVGEPDDAFRERTETLLLHEKQKKRCLEGGDEASALELTAEERRVKFRKLANPDLTPSQLSSSFESFCPPAQDEGFDEVSYTWLPREKGEQYIKDWIRTRKLTARIEDLQPSDWFRERHQEWQKELNVWHTKHQELKAADPSKRAAAAALKAANAASAKVTNGDSEKEDKDPMLQLEEELEAEELDIFGVEDVSDVSNGEPLYSNFAYEDWALLSLRFELHLLVHAFVHDVADPERVGVPLEHIAFYYFKYFKKGLSPKNFGVETIDDVLGLVRDAVIVSPKSRVLESQVSGEYDSNEIFLKLAEEDRRDRQRRLDAGDQTAQLRIPRPISAMQFTTSAQIAAGQVPLGGPAAAVSASQQAQKGGLGKGFVPRPAAWASLGGGVTGVAPSGQPQQQSAPVGLAAAMQQLGGVGPNMGGSAAQMGCMNPSGNMAGQLGMPLGGGQQLMGQQQHQFGGVPWGGGGKGYGGLQAYGAGGMKGRGWKSWK